MFTEVTRQLFSNPKQDTLQQNYGIAITDVDNDGELEVIVAG